MRKVSEQEMKSLRNHVSESQHLSGLIRHQENLIAVGDKPIPAKMQKQRHFSMNLAFAYTLAGMHIFLRVTRRAFPDGILLVKIRKARGSGEQVLPSFFIIW